MNKENNFEEKNETKEINLSELYDGKVNDTLVIDPVTKEETFLEPKKNNFILIILLVMIVSLGCYYVYNKTNLLASITELKQNTTTTYQVAITTSTIPTTTNSIVDKKSGRLNCLYENKNDNETINSNIEINYEENLVSLTKFKLDVTSNKTDLNTSTTLENDYQNFYIKNSSLYLDKINYTKNESSFSLLIDTDYSIIKFDDIVFEENKSYLYLKPVKDETYEDIKLKYETIGYICNYVISEGNHEE